MAVPAFPEVGSASLPCVSCQFLVVSPRNYPSAPSLSFASGKGTRKMCFLWVRICTGLTWVSRSLAASQTHAVSCFLLCDAHLRCKQTALSLSALLSLSLFLSFLPTNAFFLQVLTFIYSFFSLFSFLSFFLPFSLFSCLLFFFFFPSFFLFSFSSEFI